MQDIVRDDGRHDGARKQPVSSSNSVGVAFPQPRVEVRSASTLGAIYKRWSNAVSVALSRMRYPQWANNPKISVSDRISLQKILVLGHKSTKKILVSGGNLAK